jgi:hypothetical protein
MRLSRNPKPTKGKAFFIPTDRIPVIRKTFAKKYMIISLYSPGRLKA